MSSASIFVKHLRVKMRRLGKCETCYKFDVSPVSYLSYAKFSPFNRSLINFCTPDMKNENIKQKHQP